MEEWGTNITTITTILPFPTNQRNSNPKLHFTLPGPQTSNPKPEILADDFENLEEHLAVP